MEYKRNEIGAGIFLLVSFVILAVMIFAVSDIQSLFKKKKEIKVLFRYSDGIEKNAQVRLSGIRIGNVTNVRVAPEQGDKIELTLSIFSDTVIREDTKAAIKTLGLVGGKYVELTGGLPSARVLKSGGMLVGEESFKLEDLTKAGLEVVGKLTNIADNLDRMPAVAALTGAIRRGDAGTVAAHLAALAPRDREVYAALGLETLTLARAAGLAEAPAAAVQRLLEGATTG